MAEPKYGNTVHIERTQFKSMVFEVTVEFRKPAEDHLYKSMDVVEELVADSLLAHLETMTGNDGPKYNVLIKDRRQVMLELDTERNVLEWWERPLD